MKKNILLWTALLCLSGLSASFAAEQMDEKQYAPAPDIQRPERAPAPPDTVIAVPDRQGGGAVIVAPFPPDLKTPSVPAPALPTVPVTPSVPVPPAIVVLPDAQPKDAVVEIPDKNTPARLPEKKTPDVASPPDPEKLPEKTVLTPGDFLPLTPRKVTPKTGKQPKIPPEPTVTPQKDQAQKEKSSPRKGEALKIPEDAAKNGKLDFLEGCWVGTRPEYGTKRIVKERFCFDKNGVGKRYIYDPGYAGECVGSTKALVNSGGTLRMNSSKMFCTSGDTWGASEMTCRGEGQQTPCTWVFRDIKNARQSYKIQFVRE
ncbi:MAG: hypothetical protein LBR94_01465 [Desulfovibrio sp.]|jgi:hypothetical protein|nr:hypothetical protein [Desulfovibrio sp.]